MSLVDADTGDLSRDAALELTARIKAEFTRINNSLFADRHNTAEARRQPKHTYFIRAARSGLIKIGCASDPAERLRSLSTGSPEPLELLAVWRDGGRDAEREMHELFASYRSHGEWFHPSEELYAAIGAVQ